MLLPSHRAAGEAVRALDWVGERRAVEALTTLKSKLPKIDDRRAYRYSAGTSRMDGKVHQPDARVAWLTTT
jgi:hypothetical protein